MHDKVFDGPVFVQSGRFLIQEIASVDDALDFLYEWPEELRDLKFQTIESACLAAHDGRCPVGAAREAFAKWARLTNISADETLIAALIAMRGKTGQGDMQA